MRSTLLCSLLFAAACATPPTGDAAVGDVSEAMLTYSSNIGTVDYSGSVSGLYYNNGPILTDPVHLHLLFYGIWSASAMQIVLDFEDASELRHRVDVTAQARGNMFPPGPPPPPLTR